MGRTRSHAKKPYKFDLEGKGKDHIGFMNIYATHCRLMVIHPCAKYGMPMSKQKEVMGRTRICTNRWMDGRTDRVYRRTNKYQKKQLSIGSNYTNKCNKEFRSMQENKK